MKNAYPQTISAKTKPNNIGHRVKKWVGYLKRKGLLNGSITVQLSDYDKDNFSKNRLTILITTIN